MSEFRRSYVVACLCITLLFALIWLLDRNGSTMLLLLPRDKKLDDFAYDPQSAFPEAGAGLNPYSYKEPIAKTPAGIVRDEIPIPVQVMEQYKQWHSIDALKRNPDLEHRKFAIGFYSCPFQAGNRLHNFFNSKWAMNQQNFAVFPFNPSHNNVAGMLWAVLTNRTLLWHYVEDRDSCRRWIDRTSFCKSLNQIDHCDEILSRAEWIPSYNEWSEKLGLEEPVYIPPRATHPGSEARDRLEWEDGDEALLGVDDRLKYPQQVSIFGITEYKIYWLKRPRMRSSVLHSDHGKETARLLYLHGVDFLYGMIHRYTFDFAKNVKEGLISRQVPQTKDFSIALHSRHRESRDDGCDIQPEIDCLTKVVSNETKQPIQVFIMADRPCTILKLTEYLEALNMTARISVHEEGESFKDEHGPFAGIGYFQDLAFVSQARSSFIGTPFTSSDLLLELIEFNRMMEWWEGGNSIVEIEPLPKCIVHRGTKGYNIEIGVR